MIEPEVPEFIRTDPTRLRQILSNLFANAVKFTAAGRVALHVGMQAADGAQALRFTVADTGIGLNQKQAVGLFQPFAQADASIVRRFGGSGLGLSLARTLAEALNGKLTLARSVPGEGSTFELVIPFPDPSPEPSPLEPERIAGAVAAQRTSMLPAQLAGLNLLLVDDDPAMRSLYSSLLQRAGATVATAADAGEGIAAATSGRFDVVIADVQMGDVEGPAMASELRVRGYTRPIIGMSADVFASKRCIQAGCDEFLLKPVTHAALIESIARIAKES